MSKTGLLVIDRLARIRGLAGRGAQPTRREPAIASPALGPDQQEAGGFGLTSEDVLRRYRGFDGAVWPESNESSIPLEEGLAPVEKLAEVEEYVRELQQARDCDVILLAWSGTDGVGLSGLGWSFLGFDVGFYESEDSFFSVIFNEVIFGLYAELASFGTHLNSKLLFGLAQVAESLVATHNRYAAEGKDVETGSLVEVIGIYGRTNAGPQGT